MKIFTFLMIFFYLFCLYDATAQDDSQDTTHVDTVKYSSFDYGADLVSRYIFRGLDFGSSPAIQPHFSYSYKGFTIGAWGSYAFIATPAGIEADLYVSYDFDFGLSLFLYDYYFPVEELILKKDSIIGPVRKGSYFDYANHHYFEIGGTQYFRSFYASLFYGFHNMDNAIYVEGGYEFKWLTFFVGGGNKIYSKSEKFNIVNVGVKARKDIRITKNYAIGLTSSVVLNPNMEQIHIVFGLCL